MGNFKLLLEEDTGVKEEGLRVGTFFHDLLVLIVTINERVCVLLLTKGMSRDRGSFKFDASYYDRELL